MPGLFKLDIVCKIGRQGLVKGAHRDLSEPLAGSAAPGGAAGQGAPWCSTAGSAGSGRRHSLQQSYSLPPGALHLPGLSE